MDHTIRKVVTKEGGDVGFYHVFADSIILKQ